MTGFTRLAVAVAIAAVLTCSAGFAPRAFAGPDGQPEAALLKRLKAAVAEPAGFHDPYVAEVWLVDMSARLARYAPKAMAKPAKRLKFLHLLHAEATRAGVSPELVLAVINIESDFRRFAISSAGAEGYMQIMPFWLKEADAGRKNDNLFDPQTNLRMGCTILRYYLDRSHGKWVQALARYNGSYGKPDYPYKVLHALNTRWSPG
ncbi:MAG: transglycosylase SLT domain-containing protein [Sinobacteraceae bacterium]|nr:transglycosylase SLT domain-containing protein [Nevskiaceae bacterium]